MARGYWRNWTEMYCQKCGHRCYKKYIKKVKDKYLCQCGNELTERND